MKGCAALFPTLFPRDALRRQLRTHNAFTQKLPSGSRYLEAAASSSGVGIFFRSTFAQY
jgi:hypothetical protein